MSATPEGFKLVPVEPTPEMLDVARKAIDFDRTGQNTYFLEHSSHREVHDKTGALVVGAIGGTTIKQDLMDAWAVMLAAAPQPPADAQASGPIPKGWRYMPTLEEVLKENQRLTSLLVDQKRIYDEEIGRLVSNRTAQDAEVVGLQATVGTISRLVDDMRALLVDVERECSADGFGGQFEDGESKIIDRVRATLEMLAAPQPIQRAPLTDEQIDAAVDVWFTSAMEGDTAKSWHQRMRLALQRANELGGQS